MRKTFFFLLLFITNFINLRCGIPSPDSVQQLNAPSIYVGTKKASGSYFIYSEVKKFYNPNYIRIRIQAYQPETDFSGFMIYINNSVDINSTLVVPDDGTKASIQNAHLNHYYYDSSRGNYPKQVAVEGRFIISSGTNPGSGLYPTISINELAAITTASPLAEPAYPALTRYPVEFYFDIKWDGKNDYLTYGAEKKYNIAITAVDVASKLESKLSNVIQVRFNNVLGDGDFNYDANY